MPPLSSQASSGAAAAAALLCAAATASLGPPVAAPTAAAAAAAARAAAATAAAGTTLPPSSSRAIRLHTLIRHLQPHYDPGHDAPAQTLELSGGVLQIRTREDNKIKFLTGEMFCMATKIAARTAYAHCAPQYEAFVDNIVSLWNRIPSHLLQTYYYAVADKVAALPQLHTFASDHAFEYEFHVRIPFTQGAAAAWGPPLAPPAATYAAALQAGDKRPRQASPPPPQQQQLGPTRAQQKAAALAAGHCSGPQNICDAFAAGHCARGATCSFEHYCLTCRAHYPMTGCPYGHLTTHEVAGERARLGMPVTAPRRPAADRSSSRPTTSQRHSRSSTPLAGGAPAAAEAAAAAAAPAAPTTDLHRPGRGGGASGMVTQITTHRMTHWATCPAHMGYYHH